MAQFSIDIEGQIYHVEDAEEGYKVTFPNGLSLTLDIYLDERQETAFAFEMKLAQKLGEKIIQKTM